MTTDAQKRLEAIASLEDLGAGFALATHDLEIRGAGELLGEDQSGSMETIGFSLYMELLENAVDALKAGREPSLEDLTSQQTEVELRMPSLLPDDFIPDVNTRLSFYKRIASAKNENELEEIKVELIDRFGLLPDPARNLLDIARLRQQAQKLGIRKLESNEKGGTIEFNEKNNVNPMWLIGLLQKQPQHYHWMAQRASSLRRTLPSVKRGWSGCASLCASSKRTPPPDSRRDAACASYPAPPHLFGKIYKHFAIPLNFQTLASP